MKRSALGSLFLVMRRYDENGCKYLAASLSFYAILSFIPLLFTILNLFGYMVGSIPGVQDAVIEALGSVFPAAGGMLTGEIRKIVAHSEVGWLSFAVFLWIGGLVFGSLEYSMHRIFGSPNRRHLLLRTGMKFFMVLFVGLLMVISFWLACMPSLINSYPPIAGKFPDFAFYASNALTMVYPIILMTIALTGVYKYLPDVDIPFGYAFRAGASAALLWEAAKFLFAAYVDWVADIGGIYGPLGAAVVFLLWVYYSSSIILIVAETLHMKLEGEIA